MNSTPHIEIVQFIEQYIEKFRPNRIFTHHPNDLNDDHRQVSRACSAAFRIFQRKEKLSAINSLFFMEISSSTDWAIPEAQLPFIPNVFFDIEKTIDQKIEALNMYRNVMRPSPHPRSSDNIKSLAKYRGSQSGFLYAESFQLAFSRSLNV